MAIVNPRTAGTARTLTGLALILGLVLTGCGNSDGDDEGTGGATSTPTTTTSTQPGEGEYVPASADGPAQNVPVPELPEEAKEQSIEGAEATLEYWWETVEYLHLTGDADPLLAVSGSDCVTCHDQAENWTSAYADDHWLTLDGKFEVRIRHSETLSNSGSVHITYESKQPTTNVVSPQGELLEEGHVDGYSADTESLMSFDENLGHWTMLETRKIDDE